jgi:hypothetical protein
MTRKNYMINEVSEKFLEDLKKITGCGYSEIVRRAIEVYWELKTKK